MSNYVRWNPFREIDDMLYRYHRALSGLPATPSAEEHDHRELLARADWQPAVDILENDQAFVLQAELPAVAKENVKVNVNNGVLTISGERRQEKTEGSGKNRRIERVFGSFARSFTLPDDVDSNAISADYKDGLLTLTIPKLAKAPAKAIEVKIH